MAAGATNTTLADTMRRWAGVSTGAADGCKRPLAVASVSLEGNALLALARFERAAERGSDAPWALFFPPHAGTRALLHDLTSCGEGGA